LRHYTSWAANNDIGKLLFWRGGWLEWDGKCYQVIDVDSVTSRCVSLAKKEFDRIYREKTLSLKESNKESSDTGYARKVTRVVTADMLQVLKCEAEIPAHIELNTWLNDPEREGLFISLKNGILDIDKWLAGDECLLPHSPLWFSTTCLPYRFDPNAKCPKWHQYLDCSLEGDQERIAVLQMGMKGLLLC
jgi:putative DNA primase/helicase